MTFSCTDIKHGLSVCPTNEMPLILSPLPGMLSVDKDRKEDQRDGKGGNSSFHQMNKAIETGMNLFEKEGWDALNRKSYVCSQLTLVKTSGYVYLRTRLPGCE